MRGAKNQVADWYEFSIDGKRNLKVNRIGKASEGRTIHIVLTVSPRKRKPKWRGLWLDLDQRKAGWVAFESRRAADAWAKEGSLEGITAIG
jgi:hypothetical protein